MESQFGLQLPKEAQNTLGAFREGVGRQPEATISQFRHGLRAGLVSRRQLEVEGRRVLGENPGQPALRGFARSAKNGICAPESLSQLHADQYAAAKFQSFQVIIDVREIVITKLAGEHREECRERLGFELSRLPIGELSYSS